MRTTRLQNFRVLAFWDIKTLSQNYLCFVKRTLIVDFSQFSQLHLCAVMAYWLKVAVFEVVVIEQHWVQIRSQTSVLPQPQMI